MKRFFVILLSCLCSLAANGQKERLGQALPHAKPGVDYSIRIHISGIHLRSESYGEGQRDSLIYADAVMDGRKIELCFNREPFPGISTYPVLPSDYQARLVKDSSKKSSYRTSDSRIEQQYELLMPDGTVLTSTVTGVSE